MRLDIRIPIGLMFGILGAILAVFGLVSDARLYERSLGINVNLYWGGALLVFSAFMLVMAWWAHRRRPATKDHIAAPHADGPIRSSREP